MTVEIAPGSVASDGNLKVVFVAAGTAVTVASVEAGTPLTYSFTPSGFNRNITEETVNDERLTLAQVLQKKGRSTEELEVQYVFGSDDDVAYPLLKEDVKGQLVVRYAVPNEQEFATGDIVDVIHIECGKQRRDAPAANGTFTITQNLRCYKTTETDKVLAAA